MSSKASVSQWATPEAENCVEMTANDCKLHVDTAFRRASMRCVAA